MRAGAWAWCANYRSPFRNACVEERSWRAAEKYLVPLARANQQACLRLVEGVGSFRLSSRDMAVLYTAYRDGNTVTRRPTRRSFFLCFVAIEPSGEFRLARQAHVPSRMAAATPEPLRE